VGLVGLVGLVGGVGLVGFWGECSRKTLANFESLPKCVAQGGWGNFELGVIV